MKQQFKRIFSSGGFARNVFTLISGTTSAQLIPILLQPVLRRIYTPADFGTFSVYLSMVGVLTILANFRYPPAIVLPEENKNAANIVGNSIFLGAVFSLLLAGAIIFFQNDIVQLVDFPADNAYLLYLLPVSVFLLSSYNTMNFWLIRQKAFKSSAKNKVVRRSVEGAVQTGAGFGHFSAGLVIGDIIGNMANVVAGGYQLIKNQFYIKYLNRTSALNMAKRYSEFPKYNLLPALLNTACLMLPVIFINRLYSETIAGFFDLTKMVLVVPTALIATTISQVLLQRVSEKRQKKLSIKKDLLAILGLLSAIATAGITIILLWGPLLFSFIFGAEWKISGNFAQIVVFGFLIRLIVSPLSQVFIALERIKISSLWQVLYFLGIISLLWFDTISVEAFLTIYMFIDVAAYSVYLLLIYLVVNQYEKAL